MALERKDYQPVSAQNISTQQHIPMTREQVLTKLDELLNKTMEMQEYTRDQAEAKLQISMLTAIIKEQHELLTAFLEDTKNTQINMNDQMRSIIRQRMDTQDSKLQWIMDSNKHLLNVQEVYKNEVRDHTVEIIRDLLSDIKQGIDCEFDSLKAELEAAIKSVEERVNEAAKACDKSVEAADESAASLLRVGAVGTILLVLSPLVAIADIVIRIIQMNM